MYLSDFVCVRIIEAVAKSRSLLSIHLTGNHIESDETRQQMRDLLKPRKRTKKHTEIKEGTEFRQYVNLGSDSSDKELEKKEWQQSKIQANPSNSIKHKDQVRLPQGQKRNGTDVKEQKFIFTRILGHFEMPRSHRWIETNTCYYCENHQYTLVLASKSLCKKYMIKPSDEERKEFVDRIENAQVKFQDNFNKCKNHPKTGETDFFNHYGSDNEQIFYEGYEPDNEFTKEQAFKNTMICGKFTNWRTKPMIPIKYFLKALKKNKLSH